MSLAIPRAVLAAVLLVVLVLAGVTLTVRAVGPAHGPRSAPPGPVAAAGSGAPPARPPALAALHAWDVRRARAWARGDPAALRELYVPRSGAGRRDLAMLRAWERRGLRVRGLRTQVLSVELLRRRRGRLVLQVTDRLAAAYAVGAGTRVPLPRDAVTTRVVVLCRPPGGGGWRVAAVSPTTGPRPARR